MTKGARCVFQFYPENPAQVELIVASAMKAGFSGGLVVDYPNSTKAKKYFLCLFAGVSMNAANNALPKGLDGDEKAAVSFSRDRIRYQVDYYHYSIPIIISNTHIHAIQHLMT